MTTIEFEVLGTPQQQGSKRTFVPRGKDGQPVRRRDGSIMVNTVEMNAKLGSWRRDAIAAAAAAIPEGVDAPVFTGAVSVQMVAVFPRPKHHFGTGRNAAAIKPSAPTYHSSAPDLDKLQRAVGDVLTQAGVLRDDCLIATWEQPTKVYGARPRVIVSVAALYDAGVGAYDDLGGPDTEPQEALL